MQVLGPMAFRRRDLLAQLWRLCTHVFRTHEPASKEYTTAYFAVQKCILPATCLLPMQTYEWAVAWQALSLIRQVERCRLYYETSSLFALDPRDPLIGKHTPSDLASRLLRLQCSNIGQELFQLQKKAYLPTVPVPDRVQARASPCLQQLHFWLRIVADRFGGSNVFQSARQPHADSQHHLFMRIAIDQSVRGGVRREWQRGVGRTVLSACRK